MGPSIIYITRFQLSNQLHPKAHDAEKSKYRQYIIQVCSFRASIHFRADSVFESWGFRAPAPTLGQDPEDYRRDLTVMAKKQLPYDHELRKIKLWKLPRDIFETFEPQVYRACREAAARPDSVAPGEMREVTKINPQNGAQGNSFHRQRKLRQRNGQTGPKGR